MSQVLGLTGNYVLMTDDLDVNKTSLAIAKTIYCCFESGHCLGRNKPPCNCMNKLEICRPGARLGASGYNDIWHCSNTVVNHGAT